MTCGACGEVVPEEARFCPACGHALQARVDERRVVTVLFADLVRFTSLGESMDPEHLKNLVDRCFEGLVADVAAFGGQVDKILGDAIVALFGAPVAHEDDAERAVRAALQMQQTLAAHASEIGLSVEMRVGVNTGEVLVGALRSGGDYTAMGDVVNTASRLQTMAAPGQVVVGPFTHAATRDVVRYVPLGEVAVRGREEPVEAWVAHEAVALPGHRPRRTRTPLVGRDAEMGLLSHALAAAVTHSRAHLVLLVGEAGMGKSRLADEVVCTAHDEHAALVLEGRCVPYGEANVWWPIAEALAQVCGVEPADALDVAAERCRSAVVEATGLAGDSPDVGRVAEGLLFLFGYHGALRDLEPSRARDEAGRAVRVLLEALARRGPLVLVLAELHWADQLVLDLVDKLLDGLRSLPLLIVATARPELESRWTPRPGRHNLVVVNLDPLARAAASRLLELLLGGETPSEVRELLLDRGGGNPFFLEELVALLDEAGVLQRDGGGFRVPAGRQVRELPATLHGLVAARIDGLAPPLRSTLEDAAVIGRTGRTDALAALTASHDGAASAALDDLVADELLVVDGDTWAFRSEVVREVAYGTLTMAERARRHATLALWLDSTGGRKTEDLELLAHHWSHAAELAGELGAVAGVPADVRERALAAIERAAAYAEERDNAPRSARLADHGLRLVGEENSPLRRRLLIVRASARGELRELDAARDDIAAVLKGAEEAGDRASQAHALTVLGQIEQHESHLATSTATLDRAVHLWREIGDRRGEAGALRVLGMTALLQGENETAERAISEALEAFRVVGDRRLEAWALQNLAWVAMMRGDNDTADTRLHESITAFSENGDWGGLGWALGLLAWVRFNQGDLVEAERLGSQIVEELRQASDPWPLGMMTVLLSNVLLWTGRTAEAIERAQEARRVFASIGDRWGELQAAGTLVRGLVAAGRLDEAFAAVETAHELLCSGTDDRNLRDIGRFVAVASAAQAGEPARWLEWASADEQFDSAPFVGQQQATLALVHLQLGDVGAALQLAEPALTVSGVKDTKGAYADAASVAALVYAAAGRPDDALAFAQKVEELDGGTYADRVTALTAAGLAHAQHGRLEDAATAFERAETILAGTGDRLRQALLPLARAHALEAVDAAVADRALTAARAQLEALGAKAPGWDMAFRLAAKPTYAAEPVGGADPG